MLFGIVPCTNEYNCNRDTPHIDGWMDGWMGRLVGGEWLKGWMDERVDGSSEMSNIMCGNHHNRKSNEKLAEETRKTEKRKERQQKIRFAFNEPLTINSRDRSATRNELKTQTSNLNQESYVRSLDVTVTTFSAQVLYNVDRSSWANTDVTIKCCTKFCHYI